jgi:hypothetical protein
VEVPPALLPPAKTAAAVKTKSTAVTALFTIFLLKTRPRLTEPAAQSGKNLSHSPGKVNMTAGQRVGMGIFSFLGAFPALRAGNRAFRLYLLPGRPAKRIPLQSLARIKTAKRF